VKYRSRSEIVGLLLDAPNGAGATKTKLMHVRLYPLISWENTYRSWSKMVWYRTKKESTLTGRLRRASV